MRPPSAYKNNHQNKPWPAHGTCPTSTVIVSKPYENLIAFHTRTNNATIENAEARTRSLGAHASQRGKNFLWTQRPRKATVSQALARVCRCLPDMLLRKKQPVKDFLLAKTRHRSPNAWKLHYNSDTPHGVRHTVGSKSTCGQTSGKRWA